MENVQEINEKVLKYERFVNDILREDLKRTIQDRDKIYAKMADYFHLKNSIQGIKDAKLADEPLRTQMDLGCNFYVNTVVPDPSYIFVNIGLDVYLKFSLDEAVTFIERKVTSLKESTIALTKQSASIKARIKLVLQGLQELQMLDKLPKEENVRRDIF